MKKNKLLLVSSSGGHFEQLRMIKPLLTEYEGVVVTEKTKINNEADYYLIQNGHKERFFFTKMLLNTVKAFGIMLKEKPNVIISTGTSIIFPFVLWAKLKKCKIIYIETFARIHDCTRTGKVMYKYADLFIVQWESLLDFYPNAVYGGSIY
ncbi:polysaccharide biosynthesis protein [Acidaminobacter sp. JC074]|uniref:PssD/Cps14F family polysaccharide biosynthesis glycosyltransferase n=1 Tax=Acidaminobacter sp. JC074 TaxID=2530199 RepID=UPI001F0D7F77|nr:PssD/Cps14F family polysaccharide biosynthesis glycosyltransferase [Acidaminobacter sp. JC074]MCH4890650.1 polysaccharide biosynthesis protein [Acidaminobacter sp. JC074]